MVSLTTELGSAPEETQHPSNATDLLPTVELSALKAQWRDKTLQIFTSLMTPG